MIFDIFRRFDNLRYGLSEKPDGSMKLLEPGLKEQANRKKFLLANHVGMDRTVSALLVNGNKTAKVGGTDAGKIIPDSDGLVTQVKNLFLAITVADCFPVYFYDPKRGIVALAHCGWRGITDGLIPNLLGELGSGAKNILAGIGPGIQACHFEIREDIVKKFGEYPEAVSRRENKLFVDLPKIITGQLLKAGIAAKNLENFGECTYHNPDRYFSFRRDKPKIIEPMLAYIGMA